jgi:DNA-nicking Smr family endonuclease
MSKKKKQRGGGAGGAGGGAPGEEDAVKLPKFSGFNALAAGLGDLKAKIDADKRREQEEKKKQDEARIAQGKKPLPPPKEPSAREYVPTKRTAASDREDDLTFHRMMSGVTPLENRGSRVAVATESRIDPAKIKQPIDLKAKAEEEAKSVLDHLHHLVDDGVRFEVTDDGKRVEGRRVDVPPNLLRELRRGVLPIDGRLDLHGLAPEAAREKVLDFLRTQRTRGERCVLIIHGKGEGVLRGEISAWLSQGRAREHVAAFATAHQDDGGEGAVYVALRR